MISPSPNPPDHTHPRRHSARRTMSKTARVKVVGAVLLIVAAVAIFMCLSSHPQCTEKPLPYKTALNEWQTEGEFGPIYEWEGDSLVEPAVVWVNGVYHMFYRARWSDSVIGYAWSNNDGKSWDRLSSYILSGAQPYVVYNNNWGAFTLYVNAPNNTVYSAVSKNALSWATTQINVEKPEGWHLCAPGSKTLQHMGDLCVHAGTFPSDVDTNSPPFTTKGQRVWHGWRHIIPHQKFYSRPLRRHLLSRRLKKQPSNCHISGVFPQFIKHHHGDRRAVQPRPICRSLGR